MYLHTAQGYGSLIPGSEYIRTWIAQRKIECVISIPNPEKRVEFDSDYRLRRMAVDFSIPILTNLQVADLFVQAISDHPLESLATKQWAE
jgi:methylglyoxal synthase